MCALKKNLNLYEKIHKFLVRHYFTCVREQAHTLEGTLVNSLDLQTTLVLFANGTARTRAIIRLNVTAVEGVPYTRL